jgi:hypothetical protein
MDLVEAAVRTRRHAEATAHVTAMRDAQIGALSPRLALLAAGSAAIAATGGQASELFLEALAVPGAERWPFELARIRLAYGECLRRTRATAGARVQLTAALDVFQRLGARPWAARAGSELRATRLPASQPREPGTPALTPQEREIAMLAATGLTNKQIGERLYLSYRTIAAHLYQIFPSSASPPALRCETPSVLFLPGSSAQTTRTERSAITRALVCHHGPVGRCSRAWWRWSSGLLRLLAAGDVELGAGDPLPAV